jgi:leucyl/phenylalanyl-tRNA--protein transferase
MVPSRFFPPAETADEDGLLGVGGRLSTEWLLDAYSHGIFPWPAPGYPLLWWSPDPRAIIKLDAVHVSRRLERTIRGGRFEVTFDRDFAGVMHGCATAQHRGRRNNTWITPAMLEAYQRLHQLGHAHSVEAWQAGTLAGGVYGVALQAAFFAESMFYGVRDASKVALVHLVRHLAARGYTLLDIQQLTPHTERMGAIEIPRSEFLKRLEAALGQTATFADDRTRSGCKTPLPSGERLGEGRFCG